MPIRRRITDPNGFSQRVSELRERRQLTLAQLGRQVGVSGTCVWNWESGNTFPKAGALKALADALGTTATYLVEGGANRVRERTESERPNLSQVIRSARESIAETAGVSIDKVRVTLDYNE
jgi:transcriptional regulator with XRE-family HTH domain